VQVDISLRGFDASFKQRAKLSNPVDLGPAAAREVLYSIEGLPGGAFMLLQGKDEGRVYSNDESTASRFDKGDIAPDFGQFI
jgi:hypothetical protein